MKILAFKPGHDGSVAYLRDGHLVFSYEAEKDSFPRFSELHPSALLQALGEIEEVPDLFAISGWHRGYSAESEGVGGGYFGHEVSSVQFRPGKIFGMRTNIFESSHERSHLFCSYGLSPFVGRDANCLVWEGHLGAFYRMSADGRVTKIAQGRPKVGELYLLVYQLGKGAKHFSLSGAGKLMALAGYGQPDQVADYFPKLYEQLCALQRPLETSIDSFRWCPLYDCGVESQEFRNFARYFSDRIFEEYLSLAQRFCDPSLPLVIGGGCGLNCEWNAKWASSGCFSDVFVPPCTNDTGSAIGTAIEAEFLLNKVAPIEWSAYCGQSFKNDMQPPDSFLSYKLDYGQIADLLAQGHIFAWIQGECEMGPRALGNRSLIAEPFSKQTCERLNRIKSREQYGPVAPACLAEDYSLHFEGPTDPYMLYFSKVLSPKLQAITHVDGSARVQCVESFNNGRFHSLLEAFKARTGYGVLCNTSLNFHGRGFINRMSDIVKYALETETDGFIVNDKLYLKTR